MISLMKNKLCTINKEKQNLNIAIRFYGIEEYNRTCILIDDILINILGKYDIYTSQGIYYKTINYNYISTICIY